MKLTDRAYRSLVILNTIILAGMTLGAILLVALFASFTKDRRVGELIDKYVDKAVGGGLQSAVDYAVSASRLFGPSMPEKVDYFQCQLKISPKNLRHLENQIQSLGGKKLMTDDKKFWYPALFRAEGETYDVKVRVRGDWEIHWGYPKKSWRVKFPREKLFRGMRVMDFILPHDKDYEVEKVAYDVARDLGLLVPDIGFCGLKINGVDYGTYTWMEKYGPEMLEKQGYPVGDIFRNRNVWTQTHETGLGAQSTRPSTGNFPGYPTFSHVHDPARSNTVPPYDYHPASAEPTIQDGPVAGYYIARWNDLLRLTRQAGDSEFRHAIRDLLHVDHFLGYNAVSWLFGSTHSHQGDNQRWYYDNTSGLFEPILYDVMTFPIALENPATLGRDRPICKFEGFEIDWLARRMMQVPEFRQRRNEILWELVTQDKYDVAQRCDYYYSDLRGVLFAGGTRSATLAREHRKTVEILRNNRALLRDQLEFARLLVAPTMALDEGVATLRLDLLPDCRSLIDLRRVDLLLASPADSWIRGGVRAALRRPDGTRVEVPGARLSPGAEGRLAVRFDDLQLWTPVDRFLRQIAANWTLELSLPAADVNEWQKAGCLTRVEVHASNRTTGAEISGLWLMQGSPAYEFDRGGVRQEPIDRVIAQSGLPLEIRGKKLALPRGEYTIERDLLLPRGYGLHLEAGTVLRMAPGASVVTYGPLTVDGTPSDPVRIVPQDELQPWGSFAVVRAGAVSEVRNLEVYGGSETHLAGLYLSGQLCFYWSDVTLDHCVIRGAKADDGLNVKKATVQVSNCLFRDNLSDGFDGDWIRGVVRGCQFTENKGDGIDFSGSQIALVDTLFTRMGDKGVSIGEKSEILLFNVVVKHSLIGVACKDLSLVRAFACAFYGNQEAVSFYRKKQIFGGASGRIVGSLLWRNGKAFATDAESKVASSHCDLDADGTAAPPGGEGSDGLDLVDDRGNTTVPASSRVKVSASTGEFTFQGVAVPDLAGKLAGTVRPLELRVPSFGGAR